MFAQTEEFKECRCFVEVGGSYVAAITKEMDPADIDNFWSIGYRPQPIVRYIVMRTERGRSVGLKKDTTLQGHAGQAILRLPVEEQRKLPNALQLKLKDLIQYTPTGCKMPQMCYFCRKSVNVLIVNCVQIEGDTMK